MPIENKYKISQEHRWKFKFQRFFLINCLGNIVRIRKILVLKQKQNFTIYCVEHTHVHTSEHQNSRTCYFVQQFLSWKCWKLFGKCWRIFEIRIFKESRNFRKMFTTFEFGSEKIYLPNLNTNHFILKSVYSMLQIF